MGTRFREKEFVCPVCKTSFLAPVVEAVTHQGQDSDFFPHYLGPDPLPHFLVQCVSCGYCAYPDDFSGELGTEELPSPNRIKEILHQPLIKKLPDTARKYYLAGKLYEDQKRNPYHIGNLYLRGSWACRREENRKAEIEMQQLAVRFLRLSVEKSRVVNPDNMPVVTYLVGELYRRLEDKALAREWFGFVEEFLIASEQDWVLELTRKQAELNEHFIN